MQSNGHFATCCTEGELRHQKHMMGQHKIQNGAVCNTPHRMGPLTKLGTKGAIRHTMHTMGSTSPQNALNASLCNKIQAIHNCSFTIISLAAHQAATQLVFYIYYNHHLWMVAKGGTVLHPGTTKVWPTSLQQTKYIYCSNKVMDPENADNATVQNRFRSTRSCCPCALLRRLYLVHEADSLRTSGRWVTACHTILMEIM